MAIDSEPETEAATISKFIKGINFKAKNVYNAANIPCKNLPMKYFFIDKSVFATMLKTCNSTERPPKPSKNAHKITFWEIALICMFAIKFTPFVNSSIPDNSGFAKLKSNPRKDRIGLKNLLNKSNA